MHRQTATRQASSISQQGHADTHQTCLAHLARDVAYALETSEDMVPVRFQLWLRKAFDVAYGIAGRSAAVIALRRR